MNTSAERVDRYLADSDRHHRHVRGWSVVLLGLGIAVIVLLFARGFLWPPSARQLQQFDQSGTPAG